MLYYIKTEAQTSMEVLRVEITGYGDDTKNNIAALLSLDSH